MDNQWNLLTKNNLENNAEFLEISKSAVREFAKTLTANSKTRIFAVDSSGNTVMETSRITLTEDDRALLKKMADNKITGWNQLTLNNNQIVAQTTYFEPFNWYVLVTVEKKAFYGTIFQLFIRTTLIFIISLVFAVILLILFSKYLTKPLEDIVEAIKKIIMTGDLSTRVTLQYKDETGKLGHYFNIMTSELEKSYGQMKKFALQAVVARHKEMKIRNIFQKFVPKDVIDKFFSDPESMLVGENRILSILFSDIRSFTTISEGMTPDTLVESLNKYFETMVDTITSHRGIVDKYIGDAIMAFFGAPVWHNDDPVESVKAGLEMIDKLKEFNKWQEERGREPFRIGIGINLGIVTIGNIGSEKKMDYTIIGDMVNLASRLEGLTKFYHEPLIISESLHNEISGIFPSRFLDRVVVKGKTTGVNIYSVRKTVSPELREAWKFYEDGTSKYFNRNFKEAGKDFLKTLKIIPDDYCSKLFIKRCEDLINNPPEPEWTGASVIDQK